MCDASSDIDPSNPKWLKILQTVTEILLGVAGVIVFFQTNQWIIKLIAAGMILTGIAHGVVIAIVLVQRRRASQS